MVMVVVGCTYWCKDVNTKHQSCSYALVNNTKQQQVNVPSHKLVGWNIDLLLFGVAYEHGLLSWQW